MGRKFLGPIFILAIAFLAIVFVLPKQTLSHHQGQVLGESTVSSQINFPPVASGAGFFLPDSPLYFLDETFQKIRLLVAFTAERKAKIRQEIAGERLAELRIMLSRDNANGVVIALDNLTEEANQMAASLTDAAASGRDVKSLAKELNETIKAHRKILNILADQTDGVLRLQIKTARESLKLAKLDIEDELPEDELEIEIEDDLNDEIEDELDEASNSTKRLQHAIEVLSQLASQAAEKQQERRANALRHAIEVKNEALLRQAEKQFEEEEERYERLLEAQEKAREKALQAIQKVQEAAEEFEEAQEEIEELENEDNSGSGSDNSGSSGSSGTSVSGSSGSGSSGIDDK